MTTNEAIYKVITTKYKKDAQEAHAILKALGLEVYKSEGSFLVKHPKTYKRVEYSFQTGTIFLFTCGNGTSRIKDRGDCKIDFMKYLETPWNKAHGEILDSQSWYYTRYQRSKAIQKFNQIKETRVKIKEAGARIEKIKSQIEHLQNLLVDENLSKARYENDLATLIESFGLNKKGA